MAEQTRCKHNVTGAEAELPTESLGAWQAHGWEPISDSRTFEDAEAERVDAENQSAARVRAVVNTLTVDHPTVEKVLEQVGDDPATAEAALQVEQSHENPRSTLVARLNQIAGDVGNTKES